MNATELSRKAAVISQASRESSNKECADGDFRLLIGGRLVEGAGTLDVINPATGRVLTTAPRADRAQLEQAVAAAKATFPSWSATPLRVRAGLLAGLADALEAEKDQPRQRHGIRPGRLGLVRELRPGGGGGGPDGCRHGLGQPAPGHATGHLVRGGRSSLASASSWARKSSESSPSRPSSMRRNNQSWPSFGRMKDEG